MTYDPGPNFCPFCGHGFVRYVDVQPDFSKAGKAVECRACYMRGPIENNEQIAILSWNNLARHFVQ